MKYSAVLFDLDGTLLNSLEGIALAIAAKMNIAAEKFLYLGDTDVDMQTAGAARMFASEVAWGFRSTAELKVAGARKIFDHPFDVITFFSS